MKKRKHFEKCLYIILKRLIIIVNHLNVNKKYICCLKESYKGIKKMNFHLSTITFRCKREDNNNISINYICFEVMTMLIMLNL